jgi:alkanesulfonate monooxygenase SsuD/methylene tetrahydromethanopterin reductase-like flavin-dependent oxidoreductase (luciferase family)
MKLTLRYDMRAPAFGAPARDLYEASVEQVAWADRLGFHTVYLAEHHGADDGYCPAPMIQGAAMIGASEAIRVHFSALLLPLHDPIRAAEDLAVLDLLSGGRIDVTVGLGYRPHEYRMFGIEKKLRVSVLEENIRILRQAWTGEPFEYRGESVVVRPQPVQPSGPPLYIGGSAEASAYRAAALGDGYLPAMEGLWEIYERECRRLGRPLGPKPPHKSPLFLHVSEDPERDWELVAPHVLYTARSNAEWAKERGVGATPYPAADSVEELKGHPRFMVCTPDELVEHMISLPPDAEMGFQPLMGGLPPDVGWESLRLFEHRVLPRIVDAGVAIERPSMPDRTTP